MAAIAIVGAGPGLGLSIAEKFGNEGFQVALISRSKDNLDVLTTRLQEAGVTAASFRADVSDAAALTSALERASARFGDIDVLEYSPYGGLVQTSPLEVAVDNLEPQIARILYGAITATRAVLPPMLKARRGTLLFTTGGGAVSPFPMLATMNIAQAGLRNWVLNLNTVLAEHGIHAASVAISVFIGATAPEGVPHQDPDDIAKVYWDLHVKRDRAEHHIAQPRFSP